MTTENGITFSHDIAGHQTIQMSAQLGTTQVSSRTISIFERFYPNVGVTSGLKNQVQYLNSMSATLGITVSYTLTLNAGFSNVISFGSLVLPNAKPIDWDTIPLSCRTARIWDGTESLEVMPVRGFSSQYRFITKDYNDIENLIDMVGKPYTLRVYGKPYRNCYLWGEIKKKQIKQGYSLFVVEIEIKQDSCMNGITA